MHQNQLVDDIERLFRKAEPRLLRLTRLQDVAPDSAADVVQETFIEAWQHIHQLRAPERFDAWLDGICRNICRRHQRSRGILQAQEVPLANVWHEDDTTRADVDLSVPDDFDPAVALERQDMALLLDRAMGYLPANTRDVVELCYLAELPQAEAAAQLGMTISALEARLHRARKQLRQVLNGDLRAEAESFGLALDPSALGRWRESRDWCLICGKSRFWGIFERMPDGGIDFRLRCPTCLGGDIICTRGFVDFKGTYSFRPAIKRLATKFGGFLEEAMLQRGNTMCWACHQPIQLDVAQTEIADIPMYQTWIVWKCRCGQSNSAGIVACFNEPSIRAFLLQSSHCVIEPDKIVTFQGATAIRFGISDLAGGRRMFIFADPQTLTVLATVVE